MRQHKNLWVFNILKDKNSIPREHYVKETNSIVVRKFRPLSEPVGENMHAFVKLQHADFLAHQNKK